MRRRPSLEIVGERLGNRDAPFGSSSRQACINVGTNFVDIGAHRPRNAPRSSGMRRSARAERVFPPRTCSRFKETRGRSPVACGHLRLASSRANGTTTEKLMQLVKGNLSSRFGVLWRCSEWCCEYVPGVERSSAGRIVLSMGDEVVAQHTPFDLDDIFRVSSSWRQIIVAAASSTAVVRVVPKPDRRQCASRRAVRSGGRRRTDIA